MVKGFYITKMIRDATYDDIEILLPLAKEMHRTSPVYSSMPFNEGKVRQYSRNYSEKSHTYFRVYEKDGKPVAFFLGYVQNYFFNYEVLGQQETLYTDGKNPMVGIRLSKDFEIWCKEQGAIEVNYGITHSHTPRHTSFMSRLGYEIVGTVYSKRL